MPYQVPSPVTIAVNGRADGLYEDHSNGNAKTTYLGANYKYNTQGDSFSLVLTGTIGSASGPFTGSAYTSRNNERQKVN